MSSLLQSLFNQKAIRVIVDEIQIELKQKEEVETRVVMNIKRQNILKFFENVDFEKNQRMSVRMRQSSTKL